MRNKKRKIGLVAGGAAVVIVAAVVGAFTVKNADSGILFYVDGEPVYTEEVQFAAAKERLTVRNHIMADNGLEGEAFSWDGEYAGKTALEQLEEVVLEDCVENKVIQIVAKEVGVADKIDYPSMREMNEKDTETRAERTDSGQVIYGNTSYKEADYYDYVLSNLEQQSYYKLVENGTLDISEEEIQAVYEENKEGLEAAGLDEDSAKTMGLQQKYADYIRQRAGNAVVEKIDKGGVKKVLEAAT